MPVLLLIRHGENDFTRKHKLAGRLPDIRLNERGRQQAEALADSLKETGLKAVYSSPLERAIETAEPIAVARGLEVRIEPGLVETNVGRWQGRTLKSLNLNRHWKVVQRAPSRANFPDGETFYECQARVAAALDGILRRHRPRDMIACIFHADPIKLAIAHYMGLPLDHFQRLACDTGSVSVLFVGEMGASLLKFNQRPPLDFLRQPKK